MRKFKLLVWVFRNTKEKIKQTFREAPFLPLSQAQLQTNTSLYFFASSLLIFTSHYTQFLQIPLAGKQMVQEVGSMCRGFFLLPFASYQSPALVCIIHWPQSLQGCPWPNMDHPKDAAMCVPPPAQRTSLEEGGPCCTGGSCCPECYCPAWSGAPHTVSTHTVSQRCVQDHRTQNPECGTRHTTNHLPDSFISFLLGPSLQLGE